MHNGEKIKKRFFQRLVDRIGNPLEWSMVDKCLLIICFWILAAFLVTYVLSHFIQHPRTVPFFNTVAIETMLPFGYVMGVCWIVQFAMGIWLRSRNPDNRLFAYVTVFMWWTEEAIAAVCVGPLTTPVGLTLLGMAFVCFLLFDVAIALVGLFWAALLVVGTTYASQYDFFYYAPFIASPLYQDGKVADWWVNFLGPSYLILAFLFLLLFVYTIKSWRDREAKLAEMTALLKKMFGRYLSAEVMKSLLENPAAMELGGERRTVTIMITDLRGFTAQAERLEPERVVQMLNTYFEGMVDVVLKYNGTINEIVGDALLVIFGAPQEMPRRAQHAVACAIEMQNTIKQVNAQNRKMFLPELEMGIGLNDAEVIVGNIGSTKRSKYAVVGSGVNMASRIESYTVGGQILISETVRKEAGAVLRIDGQMDVVPKGAEGPLRIYEVGGIAGEYNLILEEKDHELIYLSKRIPLEYSVLEGKHEGKAGLIGSMVKLSRKSAAINMQTPVDLMANLKIRLTEVN
jgi:class 3 adenylate cyclase